jgi:hypothetical protein
MPGTTDARWNIGSIKLHGWQPGTYLLNTFNAYLILCAHTNCDAVRFAIFESDDAGATATPTTLGDGSTYIDVTADNTDDDAAKLLSSDLGDVSVTIVAGKIYYMVLLLHRPAGGGDNTCGYRSMNAGAGPQGGMFAEQTAAALTAQPTTLATAGTGSQPKIGLNFKTAVRKICVLPAYADDAVDYLIPRRFEDSVYYWIKFTEAVVIAGEALTAVIGRENNGAESTLGTLVLDMGATDQVTFGAANVALAADEAGDTFHLAIQCVNKTSTGDTADLFYTNITTPQGPEKAGGFDFATFCHGTKNGGTRATPYSTSPATPNQIYLSGTATVASIEIGWEPVIVFGDSQAKYDAATGSLGAAIPDAFEYPRIYWPAGVGGGRISATVVANHTSGVQRYKNDTPGLGDICDMRGVLFCWAGFGVNDSAIITASSPADEISRINVAMQVAGSIQTIFTDIVTNGNKLLVISLPPYSHAVNATERKAQYIKNQFNPMIEGLAMAARASYYNPWWVMCGGNHYGDIPIFADVYTIDGTHYNAVGAAIVATLAARAYEASFIGSWLSNPSRRIARKIGMLLP